MLCFAECPVCRHPLSWTYLLRPLWSQWRCRHCASLLGIDVRRRLLLVIPLVLALPIGALALSRLGFNDFAILVALAFWGPLFACLDRARVVERCGFRCKRCGYDLQGQVTPRCPECGRHLDTQERELLAAGVIPQATRRPRRKLALALTLALVLGGLATVGVGLLRYYQASRAQATRQRLVAPRTAATPATMPSTSQPAPGP